MNAACSELFRSNFGGSGSLQNAQVEVAVDFAADVVVALRDEADASVARRIARVV